MCKGESQMKTGNLCDVAGLLVGHAQDEAARTGCTVLFAPGGFEKSRQIHERGRSEYLS